RSMGLEDEASKRFGQLSGGQQKRLSLVIATIHDPPLVLLDEPTAGLDPQARRQLWNRIEKMRESRRSVLLTTHSMEEARAVCDRVAIIDHGKIVTVDTPAGLIEKYKDDPRVISIAHGQVTLDDVFIGLTGEDVRDCGVRPGRWPASGRGQGCATGSRTNAGCAARGRLFGAAPQLPLADAQPGPACRRTRCAVREQARRGACRS